MTNRHIYEDAETNTLVIPMEQITRLDKTFSTDLMMSTNPPYRYTLDTIEQMTIETSAPACSFTFLGELGTARPASPMDVKKVIHNGPATVVMFADGSKYVSRCREGDKQSDGVGTLTCILRKTMHNKRVDVFEKAIKAIAKLFTSAGDLHALAKALDTYAKYLEA